MNAADLLALYDQQERRNASFPGTERVETTHTLRFVAWQGENSFVLHSHLSELDERAIDRIIDEEIAYFTERGAAFEWKVYSHDTPANLVERLVAHGFEAGEEETLLIRALEDAPSRLFDLRGHTVERLTDPADVDHVLVVEDEVWGGENPGLAQRLRREIVEAPDYLSVFLARVEGTPVGAAWMTYAPASDFGSMWGGSVLEGYRGRGIYGALVAARAREARARGRRFLMIDAGPMSRPIVESLGFIPVATTVPCTYTPPSA